MMEPAGKASRKWRGWILRLQHALLARTADPAAARPSDEYLLGLFFWPVGILLGLMGLGLACAPVPGLYWLLMGSEQGVVENATFLVAIIGMVIALDLVSRPATLPNRWVLAWFWVFVIGTLFYGGEEISWGQQWFHWPTPENFAHWNEQDETNLHNHSRWTEAVPNALLFLSVLVTGVISPIGAGLRILPGFPWRTKLSLIWPSPTLWPFAAATMLVWVTERLWANVPGVHLMNPFEKSLKEGLELFEILFVTAYRYDMRRRYRRSG